MSTTAEVAAQSPIAERPRAEVLRRADGLELIGRFEDSGFREPPLLARRADGQVVQLSELLFAVAEACDGRRDLHEVAAAVSDHCGRTVTADNVAFLAERKLRPLGVLALADGTTPELPKRAPLLALRLRKPLLSERAVNAGARLFTWLHAPVVVAVLALAFVAFDVWLFGIEGIAGGLRSAIYDPVLLLAVLASVVVATAFHEFGHASACRYGGARPGVMGVGFYLVWPAFYCDVTDAYRLNRRGRLRTDLGGVYFNGIFALLAAGVYFATGEQAALLAAFLQQITMLHQLMPLLRFDGYYVLTDLTGVPDILTRIKPIFRSLVRGASHEPRVAELKPWVRIVVTGYLVLLVPALAFLFATMVMAAPRLLATIHDSLGLQLDRIRDAPGPAEMALGGVRLGSLVMPVAASSLSVVRTSRMACRGIFCWARGSAPRAVATAVGTAALVGAAAFTWWPNGDYQPIRPGERGTVGEAIPAFRAAAGGRPSFTPERAAQYDAVPTVRQSQDAVLERRRRDGGEQQRRDTTRRRSAPSRDPATAPRGTRTTGAPPAGSPDPATTTGTDPGTTTGTDPGTTTGTDPGAGTTTGTAPGASTAPSATAPSSPPPATGSTAPAAPGATTTTTPPPAAATTITPPPTATTAPATTTPATGTTTTAPATTSTPATTTAASAPAATATATTATAAPTTSAATAATAPAPAAAPSSP